MKHFLTNSEKLTNNKNIIGVVSGLELQFLEKLFQNKNPKQTNTLQEEKLLVEHVI